MKTPELPPELIKSAPVAVSGMLGSEFWDEVARLDEARTAEQNVPVEPRNPTDL